MQLSLTVQPCTVALMAELEERGLLRRLRVPEPAAVRTAPGCTTDAPIYVSDPSYGPHMLLCVGVNLQVPRLATHPDNEEFLLINDGRPVRPLVLVVSRLSREALEERVRTETLAAADLVAMEMVFNDPVLSFFTMNKGTPHCEVCLPGEGQVPCFFVTEGRDLPSEDIDLGGWGLAVGC